MKKSLLLSAAALLLCANAEARQWNFTQWSSATVANLEADANWTGDEKGNGTVFAGAYWQKAASVEAGCNENGYLMANGSVIAELEGLKVTTLASGHYAIATDYEKTKDANAWGPYHGAQYFWFAGGNRCRLVIPNVKPGTKITAGLESHKPGDKRGIDMYVGDTKIDKNPSEYPDAYTEYEWIVPESENETVDVEIRPSSGCHIYYINVMEGEAVVEQSTVAYIYDSSYNLEKGYGKNGGLDYDPIYTYLADACVVSVVDVNSDSIKAMTSAQFNDSLLKYDVVVLCEAVGSGNTYAKGMVELINKVPMLNFKSYMYKSGVWNVGAGANPSPKATSLVFNQELLESELVSALLNEIELEGNELQIFENAEPEFGNLIQGYTTTAGSMFESDEVIATVGDGVKAVHAHGGKRNTYLLLPFSSDNLTFDDLTDDAMAMAVNAVKYLATTKRNVLPASTPVIAETYSNQKTTVALSCSTADAKIYYTIDGTEPTVSSTLYAEPFEVTVDSTIVKAFAIAQGFDNSAVATKAISVKAQAAAPEIAVVQGEGVTTITLKGDTTTNIYFSFNGVTNAAGAALYEAPFDMFEPATITYFAATDKLLPSEIQTCDIVVYGIPAVKDTVAHFTANEADWFTNAVILDYKKDTLETPTSNWAAKAAYYWGKSAWSCYSTTEVDSVVTLKNELGEVIKCVDGVTDSTKTYYKLDPQAVKYVASTSDTQWILRSQGQLLTGETNVAPKYTVGTTADYFAESAFDLIGEPSKGKMTFGGKASGEPYSASIESTEKFQAPFDVVTYTTNGGGSAYTIVLQTSVDGEAWSNVDTLSCAATQRYYVRDRMRVEGSEPVYVRLVQTAGSTKAQLYDIYVITTDGVTGIETINADANVIANSRIFDLQGREVRSMVRGQLYIKNGKKVVIK